MNTKKIKKLKKKGKKFLIKLKTIKKKNKKVFLFKIKRKRKW